jgi:putative peptidoglycan lipid II flippase
MSDADAETRFDEVAAADDAYRDATHRLRGKPSPPPETPRDNSPQDSAHTQSHGPPELEPSGVAGVPSGEPLPPQPGPMDPATAMLPRIDPDGPAPGPPSGPPHGPPHGPPAAAAGPPPAAYTRHGPPPGYGESGPFEHQPFAPPSQYGTPAAESFAFGETGVHTGMIPVISDEARAAEAEFAAGGRRSTAPSATLTPPRPATRPGSPTTAEGGNARLLRSSSLMVAGTLLSKLTGFVKNFMIVIALGVGPFADAYTVATTLPTMLLILLVGGPVNAVFVPQLIRAMKEGKEEGDAYANRLLTLVAVTLLGLVAIAVFGAPLIVQLLAHQFTKPDATAVYHQAIVLTRYVMPTILFYGVFNVMGQVLNARERFGAMMWTPILNNIVVIFTFGLYVVVAGKHQTAASITPAETRLLGIGTTLGIVLQCLAMLPYLKAAGVRLRPRFDWRGAGLGKTASLAKWTVLFVLANQAGFAIVSQLATAANLNAARQNIHGVGLTAYTMAQNIWMLPQTVITVSIMTATLPRMSRAAADRDLDAVRSDVSYGLRITAVAIIPAAFAFLALGRDMASVLYAARGAGDTAGLGYMLAAFGLGLIPFSAQYVVLRAFYAFEDTRTAFFNTVWIAGINIVLSLTCYYLLPVRWAVVGMAAAYGVAYLVGVTVAALRLRRKLGGLDGRHVARTYTRLIVAGALAGFGAFVVATALRRMLGAGFDGSLTALVAGGLVLAVLFLALSKRMRVAEMNALIATVRARLGR